MFGTSLVFVGLVFLVDGVELTPDIHVLDKRNVLLPIVAHPEGKDKVACFRVSVSYDQGKTWKLIKDCEPTEEQVFFSAARDGLYFFSLQMVLRDGKIIPTHPNADSKIVINSEGKAIKIQPPHAERLRLVK